MVRLAGFEPATCCSGDKPQYVILLIRLASSSVLIHGFRACSGVILPLLFPPRRANRDVGLASSLPLQLPRFVPAIGNIMLSNTTRLTKSRIKLAEQAVLRQTPRAFEDLTEHHLFGLEQKNLPMSPQQGLFPSYRRLTPEFCDCTLGWQKKPMRWSSGSRWTWSSPSFAVASDVSS